MFGRRKEEIQLWVAAAECFRSLRVCQPWVGPLSLLSVLHTFSLSAHLLLCAWCVYSGQLLHLNRICMRSHCTMQGRVGLACACVHVLAAELGWVPTRTVSQCAGMSRASLAPVAAVVSSSSMLAAASFELQGLDLGWHHASTRQQAAPVLTSTQTASLAPAAGVHCAGWLKSMRQHAALCAVQVKGVRDPLPAVFSVPPQWEVGRLSAVCVGSLLLPWSSQGPPF
jgi:hypothetical protein